MEIEATENQENEDKNGEVEEIEEVDIQVKDKKSMKKLAKQAGNAAKNISLLGRVPKKCRTFNMELAKALGILGFQNTRWMETSKHTGVTPKQILDQAHFSKTISIHKQRVNIYSDFYPTNQNLFYFLGKRRKRIRRKWWETQRSCLWKSFKEIVV